MADVSKQVSVDTAAAGGLGSDGLPRRRYYRAAPSQPPLICSRCDREVEILAVVPVLGLAKGEDPAKPVPAPNYWIGWCEDCAQAIVDGFETARTL